MQSAMRPSKSKINSIARLKFIHVTVHYRFVLTLAHVLCTKVVWKLIRVQGVPYRVQDVPQQHLKI